MHRFANFLVSQESILHTKNANFSRWTYSGSNFLHDYSYVLLEISKYYSNMC
jgi:hypothetical protein